MSAVKAVGRINTIGRAVCRSTVEGRFDATRMAREYTGACRRI